MKKTGIGATHPTLLRPPKRMPGPVAAAATLYALLFLITLLIPAQLPRMRRIAAPDGAVAPALIQFLGLNGFSWIGAALYLPLALYIVRRRHPDHLTASRVGVLMMATVASAGAVISLYYGLASPALLTAPPEHLVALFARSIFITGLPFWIAAGLAIFSFQPRSEAVPADAATETAKGNPDADAEPLSRFAVHKAGRIEFVDADTVLSISAAGNYSRLHSGDGEHLLSRSIGDLENALDQRRFIRVHRSCIVNIAHIVRMEPLAHGEYHLVLSNGSRLKSGRTYRDIVRRLIR